MSVASSPTVAYEALRSDVVDGLAASRGGRELRMGLEVELIPVLEDGSRLPVRATAEGGPSGFGLMEALAAERGWRPREVAGQARLEIPGTGLLSFEPGGQLELSTDPFAGAGELVDRTFDALRALYESARARGLDFVARGMDPVNAVGSVPLGVHTRRFLRQAAHYDALGPWGTRMMRQSAAVHVNLDLGGRPARRWGLSNRAAPFLTALFANSRRYEARDTGCRSFRAEQWRRLDPSRTGLPYDEADPVRAYLAFALDALDFMGAEEAAGARPFRDAWQAGATRVAWREHLTTLFPEVRPRGYLEIRSFDAVRPAWIGVPLVLCAGLLYDSRAMAEGLRLLPQVEPGALERAGREGMGAPELREIATQLFDLALEGASRLPATAMPAELIEVARTFRDRFTARGEDPGSEPDDIDPFEL